MVRILHLLNHCRFANGNVHAAIDLASAQMRRGDSVCIASGGGDFVPLLEQLGIRYAPIELQNHAPRTVLAGAMKLRWLVKDFRPDIIHAHMMASAVFGALIGRIAGVPLVATVHNSFDRHALVMGVGSRVIAVSDPVARQMAARGIPRSRLRTVLNGTVGAPRRDYFPTVKLDWPRPSITTICGLHDRKGVRDLIAAFDMVAGGHPGAVLNIVGSGPDRAAYEALAAALPCHDRIIFHGAIRDTKSVLSQTDIFVLASHADPCPLVLPEAREAGCAMIGTAVDGIPQALNEGAAGLLVPARDPAAIAAAIASLLDDPAALAAARSAARADIDYWTIDRVAADTRAVYRELVPAA